MICLFIQQYNFASNNSFHEYWIERAVQPEIILRSMSQLRSVSFNPRDQVHILAGGSIYDAVWIWDVRIRVKVQSNASPLVSVCIRNGWIGWRPEQDPTSG
jgi:hypothetical protein